MKTRFYFKEEVKSRNKRYGYNNCELTMYYLDKKGSPHIIDVLQYNSGSYAGGEQTTYRYLVEHGYIPKKYIDDQYYGDKLVYKHIKIFQLY